MVDPVLAFPRKRKYDQFLAIVQIADELAVRPAIGEVRPQAPRNLRANEPAVRSAVGNHWWIHRLRVLQV